MSMEAIYTDAQYNACNILPQETWIFQKLQTNLAEEYWWVFSKNIWRWKDPKNPKDRSRKVHYLAISLALFVDKVLQVLHSLWCTAATLPVRTERNVRLSEHNYSWVRSRYTISSDSCSFYTFTGSRCTRCPMLKNCIKTGKTTILRNNSIPPVAVGLGSVTSSKTLLYTISRKPQ